MTHTHHIKCINNGVSITEISMALCFVAIRKQGPFTELAVIVRVSATPAVISGQPFTVSCNPWLLRLLSDF